MTSSRFGAGGAVLILAALFGGGAFAQQSATQSLPGDLQRVQGPNFVVAYVRPGTNWTRYRTILLRKLVVHASARNTAAPGTFPESGESDMLTDNDMAQLQSDFAQSMHDILGSAGYTFVTTPGRSTLIVVPRIARIRLNAPVESSRPDYSDTGQTYSQGGDSITMAALLVDGSSNVEIAKVPDRNYGNNFWSVNNSVNNLRQPKRVFDQWATDLRDTLQRGETSQHELIMPVTNNPELDSSGATAP